jgi:hypothetical protein
VPNFNPKNMKISQIIQYDQIFHNQEIPILESLTIQLPSKLGIDYFCSINSVLHINSNDINNQYKLLREFLSNETNELIGKIAILLQQEIPHKPKYYMFDTYTSLLVLNSIFKNRNLTPIATEEVTPEHKLLMLKALLVANQSLLNFKEDVSKETDHLIRFCKIIWPIVLSTGSHRVRIDFMLQAYKSVNLLDYILSQDTISKEFRQYFGFNKDDDPMQFVYSILRQYHSAINETEFRLHHAFNDNIEENPIIKKYCIEFDKYEPNQFIENDFKSFREKPIIKLRENRYDIVNWNFVLEKLDVGLLFDLFYNTPLNKVFNNNLSTFKGRIGYDFSEKLFQKIFKETVVKEKGVFKVQKKSEIEKADFYYREHNKIFLIEYKDFIYKKHKNYADIKKDIDLKMNNLNKGTGQLRKQILKLRDNLDYFEDNLSLRIKTKKLRIYPIIVVTDTAFALTGITQYLQREFTSMIKEESFSFLIMPLVVVNFDFLLENYDELKKGDTNFLKCIDYFIEQNNKIQKKKKFNNHNSLINRYLGFPEIAEKLVSQHADSFGELEEYAANRMGLYSS